MAAASFRSFDGESEEWELYCEQLEQFFVSNKIDESMKKSELINHLGARTYKLLRDLCTPHQPKDKSYKELCAALSLHFTPPVIVHKERRTFFRAQRGENGPETVNDWIVRIKNLAANCKFGDKLPDHLVNKFVDGLSGKAFDRICEETEALTLEKAQEIALKYETDATSSSAINFVKGRNQRVEPKQKGKPVQWRNSSNGKRPNGSTSKCFDAGAKIICTGTARSRTTSAGSARKRDTCRLLAVCRRHTMWPNLLVSRTTRDLRARSLL